jgi:hypothetical protein
MACSRGHALAAGRAGDGSPRRCGAILTLQCGNRPPHHQNTPCQHLFVPAQERLFFTRNSRPSARPSTPTSVLGRAYCRRSCICTRTASPERVLWNGTTAGDGNASKSHGPSSGHATSDHALGWNDDKDDTYLLFSLFFFFLAFWFLLLVLCYELHSAGWRYIVVYEDVESYR